MCGKLRVGQYGGNLTRSADNALAVVVAAKAREDALLDHLLHRRVISLSIAGADLDPHFAIFHGDKQQYAVIALPISNPPIVE